MPVADRTSAKLAIAAVASVAAFVAGFLTTDMIVRSFSRHHLQPDHDPVGQSSIAASNPEPAQIGSSASAVAPERRVSTTSPSQAVRGTEPTEISDADIVPRADADPIGPLDSAAAITTGQSGAFFHYQAEYATAWARSPVEIANLPEIYLRNLERWISREARLGPAPWERSPFEIFGSLVAPMQAVAGRNFYLPASPEASLEWYLDYYGVPEIDDAQRTDASRVLSEYQSSRRRLLASVASRILELQDDRFAVHDTLAFEIADRQLYLVTAEDSPRLDGLLHQFHLRQTRMLQEDADPIFQ